MLHFSQVWCIVLHMATDNLPITARFPPEIHDQLVRLAAKKRRSRGNLVAGLVVEALGTDQAARRNALTEELAVLAERMTSAERLDMLENLFEFYCLECGGEHPHGGQCQCWNDE